MPSHHGLPQSGVLLTISEAIVLISCSRDLSVSLSSTFHESRMSGPTLCLGSPTHHWSDTWILSPSMGWHRLDGHWWIYLLLFCCTTPFTVSVFRVSGLQQEDQILSVKWSHWEYMCLCNFWIQDPVEGVPSPSLLLRKAATHRSLKEGHL